MYTGYITIGSGRLFQSLFKHKYEVKGESLIHICSNSNKQLQVKFYFDFINNFVNNFNFCEEDLSKLFLLLPKCMYPDEYKYSCNIFNKTLLPSISDIYCNLNMERITNENNVCHTFNMNSLSDYYDLNVQSDTLLIPDMFGNFREKFIEIQDLDAIFTTQQDELELQH